MRTAVWECCPGKGGMTPARRYPRTHDQNPPLFSYLLFLAVNILPDQSIFFCNIGSAQWFWQWRQSCAGCGLRKPTARIDVSRQLQSEFFEWPLLVLVDIRSAPLCVTVMGRLRNLAPWDQMAPCILRSRPWLRRRSRAAPARLRGGRRMTRSCRSTPRASRSRMWRSLRSRAPGWSNCERPGRG